MSALTFTPLAEHASPTTEVQRTWRLAAMALLSTRIIQGFIYWGGGSRRFIYGPSRLDPSGTHSWMANKFQTAMPGALLGMDHVISFMLQHFYLLYAGIILFSVAELVFGLMLMVGLLTRVAALASIGFSVLLPAFRNCLQARLPTATLTISSLPGRLACVHRWAQPQQLLYRPQLLLIPVAPDFLG